MAITNPLYPGYYPGEPIIRPYRGSRNIPPSEFDLGGVGEFIDQLEFDIGGMPKWVVDRLSNDVKQSLKASGSPGQKFNAEDVKQYGVEEEEELPGAVGITVNLNPIDWVQDPGKQASEMVKGWWDSVAKWSDLEIKTEREKIWRPLIEGDPKGMLRSSWYGLGGAFAYGVQRGGASPLQLTGLGIKSHDFQPVYKISAGGFTRDLTETDVYEKAGDKFLDYITYSRASGTRAGKHLIFQRASLDALQTELEGKKGSILSSIGSPLDGRAIALNTFMGKSRLAAGMSGLSEHIKYFADENNETGLKKLGGVVLTPGDNKHLSTIDHLEGLQQAFVQSQDAINDVQTQYAGYINAAKIAGNNTQAKVLEDALARFNSDVSKYNDLLSEVGSVIPGWVNSANLATSTGMFADPDGLIKSLKRAGDALSKNGLIKQGVEDAFVSELIGEYLLNPRSELNRVLNDPALGIVGGSRIRRYLYAAARMKRREDVKDIIKQLEKGSFFTTLLWTETIKGKIEAYTPAHFIGKFLEKVHYFGLVIDEDVKAYSFANVITKFGIFQNKFKLIGDGGKAFTTIGGRFFEIPLDMFGKLKDGKLGAIVVGADGIAHFANALDAKNLIDFINNPLAKAGDFVISSKYNMESVDKYLAKAARFKQWLLDNRVALGLKIDAAGNLVNTGPDFVTNIARLEALFNQLALRAGNLDLVPITKEFAGLLQKLSAKLNILQSKAFKYLSKFVAPISYVKTFIAETLAGLISQAFAGATAGVGELLAPVIQFVSQYIIQKILDVGETFIKAAVKLDFESFFEDIEKMWAFMIKIVIYALLAVVPFFMFVGFIVIVLLAAVSPANPTKSSNFNPDQNTSFYVVKDVNVKTLPLETPHINPPDGTLDNSVLTQGVKVSYAITIKALEDATGIKYVDRAVVNGSTILLEKTENIDDMTAGQEKIFGIDLPSALQGAVYENSIVTNTIEVSGKSMSFGENTTTVTRSFTIGTFSTSCPLTGGVISNGSYNSSGETQPGGGSGHGSNWYWSGQTSTCNYTIPYVTVPDRGVCISEELENVYPSGSAAACAPTSAVLGTNNTCYKRMLHVNGSPPGVKEPLRPRQDYYGYALDVISGGDPTVYLPAIEGVSEWSVGKPFPIFEGARGVGLIATAQSATANYKMYLAHLDAADLRYPDGSSDVAIGTPIGKLFTGWAESRRHVHIELLISGAPVKPEDYLCK